MGLLMEPVVSMLPIFPLRRSLTKSGIDEEQLYLAPPTNLEKKFATTKPPYYRSVSVNLPITSSTPNKH